MTRTAHETRLEFAAVVASKRSSVMDVVHLEGPERRMLLEMLASERSGEDALHVGERFGRPAVADRLCCWQMSYWVDRAHVCFTAFGRHIAEVLADRLAEPRAPLV